MRKSELYTMPTWADSNGLAYMIAFTCAREDKHGFVSIADIEARRTAN